MFKLLIDKIKNLIFGEPYYDINFRIIFHDIPKFEIEIFNHGYFEYIGFVSDISTEVFRHLKENNNCIIFLILKKDLYLHFKKADESIKIELLKKT